MPLSLPLCLSRKGRACGSARRADSASAAAHCSTRLPPAHAHLFALTHTPPPIPPIHHAMSKLHSFLPLMLLLLLLALLSGCAVAAAAESAADAAPLTSQQAHIAAG